jgi:hypothetical protein
VEQHQQKTGVDLMKKIFFDTESCGFYSPTILIQYQIEEASGSLSQVFLHNIFKETVQSTLNLIELLCENNIVGFNLAHDMFHLSRTYGTLSLLPKDSVPTPDDILDVEDSPEAHDMACLKPKGALDLMAYGRAHELQSTMNQKPIIIKKVPKILVPRLLEELYKNISFPPLWFAKRDGKPEWEVRELVRGRSREVTPEMRKEGVLIDEDFVNLQLRFFPSTGLKPIVKYLLGLDVALIEDLAPTTNPVEYSWFPSAGNWIDVIDEHIWAWSNDKLRLKYAEDDVHYTRKLYNYFNPKDEDLFQDTDSSLACAIGGLHWKGYTVDLDAVGHLYKETKDKIFEISSHLPAELNVRAPKQVVNYLKSVADEDEEEDITSSAKDVLDEILLDEDYSDELKKGITRILTLRKEYSTKDLCEKLLKAKRLYVTFKVRGTKSNRMAGGSMSSNKRGGSLNPQGIKAGGSVRQLFPLKPKGWELSSGDFDGFEVSIAEAVYGDENLHKDLLSGKSIHALWGSFVFDLPYNVIMESKKYPEDHPKGFYKKAKRSMFAKLYGAMPYKLAQTLKIEPKKVAEATEYFERHYKGIQETRQELLEDFEAMSQPNGIGSEIVWKDPLLYVESFLGSRRYYEMEFSVIKELFYLAQNLPEDIVSVGHLAQYKRKDRYQTGGGAVQSSLYSAAFSLQSSIIRSALNHLIQSPGGELTKDLQNRIWGIQPFGINDWEVMTMNIHDEVQSMHLPKHRNKIEKIVKDFVEESKEVVPLIAMDWKTNLKNWGKK